jgi:hypothetical protein
MTDRIETSLAVLERVSPRRVEILFKPSVLIDVAGLAAIFEQRKRMQGDEAVGLLVVIPSDAELDIAVLGTDQFARNDGAEGLIAMATVAGSGINEMLTNLFFAYFPQGFPQRVFTDLSEARAWLAIQERGAGSGQPA